MGPHPGEDAARHAYCPYSGHRVWAAGLADTGAVVVGCNMENAAFLAQHAEWGVIGNMALAGSARLVALVCVVEGRPATPCGVCIQLWPARGALASGLAAPRASPGFGNDRIEQKRESREHTPAISPLDREARRRCKA